MTRRSGTDSLHAPAMRLPPRALPLAARFIGGFRIGRRLGGRGPAAIHLAQDRRGLRVAIKLLQREPADEGGRWESFLAECALLAAVDDEHVVRVLDHRVVGDVAYLAMEYLPGGSLRELLREPLAAPAALSLLRQCASGVAAAHRHAIVHRDVKPENFLLRGARLVLADFGIAAHAGDAAACVDPGRLLGTAWYVAPEQLRGAAPAPSADVYSLGVLAFELLCGCAPFRGSAQEVLARHLVAPVPRLPPGLAACQDFMDRLLDKRPQCRPADATAVLQEIGRLATAVGTGGGCT